VVSEFTRPKPSSLPCLEGSVRRPTRSVIKAEVDLPTQTTAAQMICDSLPQGPIWAVQERLKACTELLWMDTLNIRSVFRIMLLCCRLNDVIKLCVSSKILKYAKIAISDSAPMMPIILRQVMIRVCAPHYYDVRISGQKFRIEIKLHITRRCWENCKKIYGASFMLHPLHNTPRKRQPV